MTITKINGGYKITDIIANQYKNELFLYYTKKESIKRFKEKHEMLYQLEKESKSGY